METQIKTTEKKVNEIKEKANKLFKNEKYPQAIETYM